MGDFDIKEHNKNMMASVKEGLKHTVISSVDFEDVYEMGQIVPSKIIVTITAERLKDAWRSML